jgi:hypothetical protein
MVSKSGTDPSTASVVQRVQLNELALTMDYRSIDQAQSLANRFKAGGWRCPAVATISEGDKRLKLSGITIEGDSPCA